MDDTRNRRPLRRGAWLASTASTLLLLMTCAALQLRAQEKENENEKNPPPGNAEGDPPAQVELRARIFEAPAGTLRAAGYGQDPVNVHHGVQGVLEPARIGECIFRLQNAPDTRLLSAPSITMLSGQRATVETGLDGRLAGKDNEGTEFEGFRLGIEPTLSFDQKNVDLNVEFVLRQASGTGTDGKTEFKELRLRPQVNMFTGSTLMLLGDHPADDQREVVLLLTAGKPVNNKEQAKADADAGADASKDNVTRLAAPPAAPSTPSGNAATRGAHIQQKMDSIIFPTVEFTGASLEEALEFLRIKSRDLDQTEKDPAKKGVNLIFKPGANPSTVQISLSLKNVPMSEALKYVVELAGTNYIVKDFGVLVPMPLPSAPNGVQPATGPKAPVQNVDSPVREKAQSIILPKVGFRDASLQEALEFLRVKAKELDPAKQGMNLFVAHPPPGRASITLNLTNAPLDEALRYVSELAGMKLRYDSAAIALVLPEKEKAGYLYTRAFRLPKGFFADQDNARQRLEKEGVTFPEGASATWVTNSNQLIVRNTMAELEKAEAVVERAVAAAPDLPPGRAPVAGPAPAVQQAGAGIIIPRVTFNEASVEEAVEFLRIKSKDADLRKQGVNILLKAPKAFLTAKITLDLHDVPVEIALKYVAELAGLKLRSEPFAYILDQQ